MEELKNGNGGEIVEDEELVEVTVLQSDGTIVKEFISRVELSLIEPWTPEKEEAEKIQREKDREEEENLNKIIKELGITKEEWEELGDIKIGV